MSESDIATETARRAADQARFRSEVPPVEDLGTLRPLPGKAEVQGTYDTPEARAVRGAVVSGLGLSGAGNSPEVSQRVRALAANDSEFGAPEPAGDFGAPEPVTSPSLTAFSAQHAGVEPADAARALSLSQRTGLAPQFVADNLDTVQATHDQRTASDMLARSPVTANYAAQGAVQAAAIRADLENMTAVEYWLTGKWQDAPGPATGAAGPYETAQTTHKEMVAPPVWQSGLAKFVFGTAGGLLSIKKATVGLTPEESQRLTQDVAGAGGAVAGATGGLRGAGAAAAEAVPGLLLAPGAKPAQAAYFTLQSFPNYYQALGSAVDEHGAPRYSDFEAKTIATGAALATGVGATIFGSAFLKAIPGAAQKLDDLLGESIVQAFTENPTLAKVAVARLAQAVPHMASGVAMMTASGAVSGGVKALADGHSPLSPEGLAEIGQQAKEGSKTGAILSLLALYGATKRFASDVQRIRAAEGPQVVPPEAAPAQPQLAAGEGPTIETTATTAGEALVTDLGRATDAATEAAQLDGMVTGAKASALVKSAPAEAQRLFASMAQVGQHDTVYIHPDATKDEAVAKAIDTALGDGGQARALAEAQGPGGMIAMPIEKYLTQIAPDYHDDIRQHVRLTPDGMTPAQAKEADPELQGWLDALSEPFTVEKLNAIAERGKIKPPTDDEINAALSELRALGFDVQDVAPLGGGAGQPPSAPPAAVAPPPPPDRSEVYAKSAKTTVNALPIRQIHPAQFALAARQAADRLAKMAEHTAKLASTRGQEGNAAVATAKITDAAGERDFARALAKEAAQVHVEMSKALDSIAKIAGSKEIRGQLGLAHPAFRDVFDAIAEAVGARKPQPGMQRQTVDQLLAVLDAKNLPVPFDEETLRDIVSDPRAWKDLTPVEARQSAGAAAAIVKMALDLNSVTVRNQKASLALTKQGIVQENALRKDLGAPAATRSARQALERVEDGLSTFNAWNLKPEVAMEALGPTMHGVFIRSIEGRNYLQQLQGDVLAHLMQHVGEIGWIKEPLKGGTALRMPKIGEQVLAPRQVTLPKTLAAKYGNTPHEWEALLASDALNDLPQVKERIERVLEEWKRAQTVRTMPDLADKFNKETMAMAFLNLGTASNEQRLTSGYNWSGQVVRSEIGKHLTLEQVDQLQGILDLLEDKLWGLVRDHAERTTGIAPPKVQAQPVTLRFADGRTKTYRGGYFPAAPHPDALKVQEVDKAAAAARATISASFVKERAQTASYPLDLNWRRVGAHIDSVLHYLAYDEPLRDISKVLDDESIQGVMRHSVGDAARKTLMDWRDVLAVGRVNNTGPMAKIMRNTLRSRAISNALSFNLPIAYMQASHIPYAVLAGEVSALNTALAASRQVPYTDPWRNLRNELTELQFRSTRWADLYRTAMSGETALLKGKVGREIDHYAFLHMEAADAVVSHVIGDAALNDAIDKGMDREAAREYANTKIRLLMPTHNVFEMSALGRDPGFFGTVALFRGLSTVVWNVNYRLYDRARQARSMAGQPPSRAPRLPDQIDMEEAPDGTWGMKAKANIYSAGNLLRMFSATAVLGTVGYLLAGHGKNKDDGRGAKGWAKYAARTAAAAELEQLPGGKDLVAPFVDAAVQGKSVGWAIEELKRGKYTPELQSVMSIVDDLGRLASNKNTTPQKIQSATNATMTIAGIGARPVTAMGVNAVQGNPKMRRPRGFFDRASQFIYPTRTYEKTWLNGIEDLITGTE